MSGLGWLGLLGAQAVPWFAVVDRHRDVYAIPVWQSIHVDGLSYRLFLGTHKLGRVLPLQAGP